MFYSKLLIHLLFVGQIINTILTCDIIIFPYPPGYYSPYLIYN